MKHVCVALADGFEEIEGLTVVDLLRRAGITVTTASINQTKTVCGAHQITVTADALWEELPLDTLDLLVLPGGMPGTRHLAAFTPLTDALKKMVADGKEIAAICAAPSVLGQLGLLKGKTACCYPGFEDQLLDAEVSYAPVCADKQVITSRGMGTAIPFALALVERLIDRQTADTLADAIIFNTAD